MYEEPIRSLSHASIPEAFSVRNRVTPPHLVQRRAALKAPEHFLVFSEMSSGNRIRQDLQHSVAYTLCKVVLGTMQDVQWSLLV